MTGVFGDDVIRALEAIGDPVDRFRAAGAILDRPSDLHGRVAEVRARALAAEYQRRIADRGSTHGVLAGLAAELGLSQPTVSKWLARASGGSSAPHGTRARYNAGCHCGPCKAANNAYKRSRAVNRGGDG